MLEQEDISAIQKALLSARSVVLILRSSASYDQVASAVALAFSLSEHKKNVQLACPEQLGTQFQSIIGSDRIQTALGNRSLQITFEYSPEMVENVSYNVDQVANKFHLVVRPKKGHRTIDPETIEYSHVGLDAEVIFLFGISAFSDIEEYYQQDEQAFHQAHTIAITSEQTNFANTNVDVSGHSCVSELTARLIMALSLPLTGELSTNLLSGIEMSTDAFRHSNVTAMTFETVASLMRNGGKRLRLSLQTQASATTGSKNPLAQAFASLEAKPIQSRVQVSQQPSTAV